jgi:hypothetical protein
MIGSFTTARADSSATRASHHHRSSSNLQDSCIHAQYITYRSRLKLNDYYHCCDDFELCSWSWRVRDETQSNTQGVWPCKLPIDSLPLQVLVMSPDLMSDMSKQSRQNFPTSVTG